MFINLASTAPVLDHQRCSKQLVLRVLDILISPGMGSGEGFVTQSDGGHPAFKPIIEANWHDQATLRAGSFMEYSIQPRMFVDADVNFDFTGISAVPGVRHARTIVAFALSYDGQEWDLGIDHEDEDGRSVRLWIPLPGYDPLCNDPTPLQVELEEAKEPEPPKVRRSIWDRLKAGA